MIAPRSCSDTSSAFATAFVNELAGTSLRTERAMNGRIEVVPYDYAWPSQFIAERQRLTGILSDCVLAVHHIGSTAVPGLAAKPIIDILIEASDLAVLDRRSDCLAQAGYRAKGEYGIAGRRYFTKGPVLRTHHVHAYRRGDANIARHLAFRDYLRAHPAVAAHYARLKREIATSCGNAIERYCAGKQDFVDAYERAALRWRSNAEDPATSGRHYDVALACSIEVRVDDLRGSEIRALLDEHLRDMYANSPPESVHALGVDALRRPDITFWTGWSHERLLGCAALRELDATHGEVKSMRTSSSQRRQGVGRAMLAHVVAIARARGYRRLSLETGSMDAFAPARRLYESFGFEYCKPFADYTEDPNSRFMTRSLDAP